MKNKPNTNGFVLITSLMVLFLLTILSLAGVHLSVLDIKTASNYKINKQALYNAENGIEVGQALLKKIHIEESKNNTDYFNNSPSWYVTLDQTGKVVNNKGDVVNASFKPNEHINFDTKVCMLLNSATNEVCCYGDSDLNPNTPDQVFWTGSIDLSKGVPVYEIESIGYHKSKVGEIKASQTVTDRYYMHNGLSLPNAALYVNGDLISHGTPQSLIGEGEPTRPIQCNGKDIIGTNDTVNDFMGNFNICGMLPCDQNQPNIIDNAPPYPVEDLIDLLRPNAELITGSSHAFSQNPTDIGKVYYYSGDIMINNLTGYGIILIDGNFTIGGGLGWNGLIVVRDNLVMNGGGNNQIVGALIVGGDVTGNGNPDVYYDCDLADKLRDRVRVVERMGWRHVKEIPDIVYEEI